MKHFTYVCHATYYGLAYAPRFTAVYLVDNLLRIVSRSPLAHIPQAIPVVSRSVPLRNLDLARLNVLHELHLRRLFREAACSMGSEKNRLHERAEYLGRAFCLFSAKRGGILLPRH